MMWKTALGLFCLMILLLLIPVRYRFRLEMWKVSVEIKALFGIVRKRMVMPRPGNARAEKKREEKEEMPDHKTDTALQEEEKKKKEDPEKKKTKEKPSVFRQIQFAVNHGLAEEIIKAFFSLFKHSKPREWRIFGEFGTGDPMTTGVVQGTTLAFLPEITEEVEWKYLEPAYKIKGEGRGRIIPVYAAFIILRLAVSKPVRQFWRYRQGGMKDE